MSTLHCYHMQHAVAKEKYPSLHLCCGQTLRKGQDLSDLLSENIVTTEETCVQHWPDRSIAGREASRNYMWPTVMFDRLSGPPS